MDVCRPAGLRIALNCCLKTGRGRKYPIHGKEENQVYIMLNVLNYGVKFMLRMNEWMNEMRIKNTTNNWDKESVKKMSCLKCLKTGRGHR